MHYIYCLCLYVAGLFSFSSFSLIFFPASSPMLLLCLLASNRQKDQELPATTAKEAPAYPCPSCFKHFTSLRCFQTATFMAPLLVWAVQRQLVSSREKESSKTKTALINASFVGTHLTFVRPLSKAMLEQKTHLKTGKLTWHWNSLLSTFVLLSFSVQVDLALSHDWSHVKQVFEVCTSTRTSFKHLFVLFCNHSLCFLQWCHGQAH